MSPRVPARAARLGAARSTHTGWPPQFLVPRAAAASSSPRARSTSRTTPTASTCSTGPGPTPTGATASSYYPKLLDAVPFTPVPGPRLLARDAPTHRLLLLRAIEQLARRPSCRRRTCSSSTTPTRRRRARAGWLMRSTVQFHWTQPRAGAVCRLRRLPAPACSATSARRSSRSGAASPTPGSRFSVATRRARSTSADWDFFYRCYTLTYRAHHSTPYLTRDFFARMAQTMARALAAVRRLARRPARRRVADRDRPASARPPSAATGARSSTSPACTSRPATTSRSPGASPTAIARFEGGAQGEHKMARGLLPVQTWSAHWLAHPQFARAVDDFLPREGAGVESYLDELQRAQPVQGGAWRRLDAAAVPSATDARPLLGGVAGDAVADLRRALRPGLPSPAP